MQNLPQLYPQVFRTTLEIARIVKEWWKCAEKDERNMLYAAACIHTLPIALEITNKFATENPDRPRNQEQ